MHVFLPIFFSRRSRSFRWETSDVKSRIDWLQFIALTTIILLLSACSAVPHKSNSGSITGASIQSTAAAPNNSAPNLPKAGSGRGGYYKDDGPGDNPPPDLELTLDAEPKIEPYSKSGNKPYVVFGKKYTPMLDDYPFSQQGIGSWYGKKFHGQKTSSGEIYDMYKMTAAHLTLPIPSYARITNLANGKQVIVKINDRGPFHSNRIVDLSYTAALKLGYVGKGSSELLLERLLPADIEKMAENKKNQPELANEMTSVSVTSSAGSVVRPDTAALDTLIASKTEDIPASDEKNSASKTASGFYLQFGAFGLRANAETTLNRLKDQLTQLPGFEIVQEGRLYRLLSGPFINRDAANIALQRAAGGSLVKPVVVQR
jgi:rare lipoprotein A